MWKQERWSKQASPLGLDARNLVEYGWQERSSPGLRQGERRDLEQRGPAAILTSHEAACLYSVCAQCLLQTAGPVPSHAVIVNTFPDAWCFVEGHCCLTQSCHTPMSTEIGLRMMEPPGQTRVPTDLSPSGPGLTLFTSLSLSLFLHFMPMLKSLSGRCPSTHQESKMRCPYPCECFIQVPSPPFPEAFGSSP